MVIVWVNNLIDECYVECVDYIIFSGDCYFLGRLCNVMLLVSY